MNLAKILILGFTLCASLFGLNLLVPTAPGDLDPTFGTAGKVVTAFGTSTDAGTAVAIQTNGKSIVVGSAFNGANFDFALARYNSDGALDGSFGTGGRVTTAIGTSSDNASSVAIQADGKIVVAGNSSAANSDFALARYNSNGSIDTSFGIGGKVTTAMGTGNDGASAVLIQTDGKIIAIGSSDSGDSDFALARYDSSGTLDSSFGVGGKVLVGFGNGTFDAAFSASLQPDGKIVVAGQTISAAGGFAIARFAANGSLDNAFGSAGKVVVPFNANGGIGLAVAIQIDSKIVVAGECYNSALENYTFALMRLNSDGTLDNNFGTAGRVETDFTGNDDRASALAIQPNGRILAAGGALNNNTNSNFELARYNGDGSLDNSFGSSGKIITDFAGGNDNIRGLALQGDGNILVAGRATTASNIDFALARYLGDKGTNQSFDFDGDSKTDISIFRPGPGQWWHSLSSDGGNRALSFGTATDTIVPADFSGDGKTDIAFFRPSTGQWFVLRSEDSSFYALPFGTNGDVPVPTDYDSDGKADLAVFRPSNSTWFVARSGDNGTTIQTFGITGDVPVAADYDGDGKSDIAIYRPNAAGGGQWWIQRSSTGVVAALQFGTATDKTVVGDYTGDGKADIAFWRPATGFWNILRSEDLSYFAFPFGTTGDLPVPGDYDGDSKIDPGVFRPSNSTWYIQRSTAGTLIQQFGIAGDLPLPNAYVR